MVLGNWRNKMRNTRIAKWTWAEGLSVITREYCLPWGSHSFLPFCSTVRQQILLNLLQKSSIILPAAGSVGGVATDYTGDPPREAAERSAAYWDVLNLMTLEYKKYIVILMDFGHNFKSFWSMFLKRWGWHKKRHEKKTQSNTTHMLRSSAMPVLT